MGPGRMAGERRYRRGRPGTQARCPAGRPSGRAASAFDPSVERDVAPHCNHRSDRERWKTGQAGRVQEGPEAARGRWRLGTGARAALRPGSAAARARLRVPRGSDLLCRLERARADPFHRRSGASHAPPRSVDARCADAGRHSTAARRQSEVSALLTRVHSAFRRRSTFCAAAAKFARSP